MIWETTKLCIFLILKVSSLLRYCYLQGSSSSVRTAGGMQSWQATTFNIRIDCKLHPHFRNKKILGRTHILKLRKNCHCFSKRNKQTKNKQALSALLSPLLHSYSLTFSTKLSILLPRWIQHIRSFSQNCQSWWIMIQFLFLNCQTGQYALLFFLPRISHCPLAH